MRLSEGTAPPLDGIRVIDRTDDFGAYAGRLLAGLGAEVILVAGPENHESQAETSNTLESTQRDMFAEFVHAGKKSVALHHELEDPEETLKRLVESADVVLGSASGLSPGAWLRVNPQIVHVVMTPFGWGLNPSWAPVDDLVVLASGGLLHLGGYLDTGPVGAYGNQSQIASGIFGAIAVLVGLIERHDTGHGSFADVSAQEAVAQALEDSLPTYALTGKLREPQGEGAREAGTGVYACADGYVSMVAGRLGTAKAWTSLVLWLSEETEDGMELQDEKWSDFSYRQTTDASNVFRDIFERFAGNHTKEGLYIEAQRRGIALSPVSDIHDLMANAQLRSRGFFHEFHHERLGIEVSVPGPPFRLSRNAQPSLEEAPASGQDTDDVLSNLDAVLEAGQTASTG